MKIFVYAISKNEAKFAERWAKSMSEADGIIVLDTGSTDDTVEILKRCGALVTVKEIEPWRFDTARNLSLELVPLDADICVCTDLDEVFESGWRQKLENAWTSETNQARYNYIWSHDGDKNGICFYGEKIHARAGFKWVNPVHEVLSYENGTPKAVTINDLTLHHYPDNNKSRESYLPLLELAVKEDPKNDRNMHYLGREYMFRGKPQKAIETLRRHLSLPSAVWDEERASSMRYIARCYRQTGKIKEAERWYLRAISEAPSCRESAVEYATFLFHNKNYHGVIFILNATLSNSVYTQSYITEPACWGALPHDLLSLAYYHLGDYASAIEQSKIAVSLSDEQRLKNNLKFFEKLTVNNES